MPLQKNVRFYHFSSSSLNHDGLQLFKNKFYAFETSSAAYLTSDGTAVFLVNYEVHPDVLFFIRDNRFESKRD